MVNILNDTNKNTTLYGEGINLRETMLTSEAAKTMVKIAVVTPVVFMIALAALAIAVPLIIASVVPVGVYLAVKELREGIHEMRMAQD